jgi:alpha-1,6-mannosyltransferase
LGLTRAIGVLIIALIVAWLLIAVLRGRLHPVGGLGVALGATVLLFPVVQPWYLLWAIIPLAAWATRPRFRIATIVITLVVGIFGPTANGDRFAIFQIIDATVASAITVLILIAATSAMLPWRSVPHPVATADEHAPADPEPLPGEEEPDAGASPAAVPGAYAESP